MADEDNQEGESVWDKMDRLPSMDDAPLDDTWIGRPPDSGSPAGQYHVPAPDEPASPSPASGRAPNHFPAPSQAPSQEPEPPSPPRRRQRRRGRKGRKIIGGLLLLALIGVLIGLGLAWSTWNGIERVSLPNLTSDTSGGTNYLIVGTDSRDGVDAGLSTAGGIFGDGSESFAGERTDTIVILRVSDDGNKFLALNRDLWLPIAGTGGSQRINTAFAGGPERLVDTIQDGLGIPIHHYMEVDFAGFLGLIDSLGGIEVEVPNPAFDTKTGLNIPQAGLVHLDAEQALAYVRTRTYTEIIDGQEVTDPTSDFGRVARQQQFLESTFNEISATRNPLTLYQAADSLAGNVRIDDSWGFLEAANFGRELGALDPESIVLPVVGFTGPNGEAALELSGEAEAVLELFR